jgi:hypothetical protein
MSPDVMGTLEYCPGSPYVVRKVMDDGATNILIQAAEVDNGR